MNSSRVTGLNTVGAAVCWLLLCSPSSAQNAPTRSAGTQRWVGERTLKPTLVVEEWAEGEPFGRIDCIAALPDGGVVVMDGVGSSGPVLVRISADGKAMKRLGRSGAGPGEYGRSGMAACLTVTATKQVALYDRSNSRLVIWNGDDSFARTVSLPFSLGGYPPYAVWQRDSSVLLRAQIRPSRTGMIFDPLAYGMIRIRADGTIGDTVPLRLPPNPVPVSHQMFAPRNYSIALPDGRKLVATSREMGFTLIDATGRSRRVSHPWQPVRVSNEERAEFGKIQAWSTKISRGMVPDHGVVSTKAAFSSLEVAWDGAVWLRVSMPSTRGVPRRVFGGKEEPGEPRQTLHEPPVFEVFGADGSRMGRLRLADAGAIPLMFSMTKTTVWAVGERPDGSHVLIRW